MNQLSNPSVTSPRTGDRSRASRVSPGNRTGQTYARQHAEAEARKAAANIDIAEVKRQSFASGYETGSEKGTRSFIDALYNMYKAEGIQAVQEFLDELDAEPESEDAA